MVFPLYDDNPFTRATVPYVTWTLIAINVVVFLFMVSGSESDQTIWNMSYGVTPAILSTTTFDHVVGRADLTLLSCMFIHGGWDHLLGNMIYLWVFGDDIEDALGPVRFAIFYLSAGVMSAVFYVLLNPYSPVPLIGASGAISGILAAYLLLRPCAKVSVFVLRAVVRVRAYWVIGGWAVLQLFLLSTDKNSDVAYLAHIGGLAAGVALFLLLRPKTVRLFECTEQPVEGMTDSSTVQ